jgi:hypothetical protein
LLPDDDRAEREGAGQMLFVGDDWADDHHHVVVQDAGGRVLGRRLLPEGAAGMARFHELVAWCAGEGAEPDPAQVVIVIETERQHRCV